jgi:tetraacyldisaccharide 4'-kinase
MMQRLDRFHRRLVSNKENSCPERCLLSLLLPFSMLYGMFVWLRGKGYDSGMFSCYRAPVPVISVGNLAVGGTGKTPVVDWLLKAFLQQGKRPAVVSRGYGGTFAGEVGLVSAGDGMLLPAAEAGDEPFLLARRNPQALVLIARKRAVGVRCAVEKQCADVVILDDGFQHRAVARDLDLVLLDANRPFGNGLPLPGGLLREFRGALERADLLLLTRADKQTTGTFSGKPSWTSRHQLADYAISLTGERCLLSDLQGKKLLAFAGIAKPEAFFHALSAAGLNIAVKLPLSDHVKFDAQSLAEVVSLADGCDALLTTEKDAVKLAAEMFNIPCYQVPMRIEIAQEAEFLAEITQRLWRK